MIGIPHLAALLPVCSRSIIGLRSCHPWGLRLAAGGTLNPIKIPIWSPRFRLFPECTAPDCIPGIVQHLCIACRVLLAGLALSFLVAIWIPMLVPVWFPTMGTLRHNPANVRGGSVHPWECRIRFHICLLRLVLVVTYVSNTFRGCPFGHDCLACSIGFLCREGMIRTSIRIRVPEFEVLGFARFCRCI